MKITHFALDAGKLQERPVPLDLWAADTGRTGEQWYDVGDVDPEELRRLLTPLAPHPLILERCLTPANDPSVLQVEGAILLEFPAAVAQTDLTPTYLTLLLHGPLLVTIRHTPMPALDGLVRGVKAGQAPTVQHLTHLVFLILDHLSDANVGAGMALRDEIAGLARALDEKPESVTAGDLARLRTQVDALVSLIENQLYCIAGLSASDNASLQESHRKAYIQDLVAEAEIAQRSAYRLEGRMTDLYAVYQMMGNDRVEKRLRILTIISATCLPLGLITGILGMNVGGLPGVNNPYGFLIVMVLISVIAAAELGYFVRKGWFD
jgi:magnesium transporter